MFSAADMLTLPAWAVGLVVVNFLVWGHWPICAKLAGAPTQAFGVVMVLTQTLCAFIACLATGDRFLTALVADSKHPTAVLCVFLGGAALAIGDFSAAAAIERLGVAVGGPVCFCPRVCVIAHTNRRMCVRLHRHTGRNPIHYT